MGGFFVSVLWSGHLADRYSLLFLSSYNNKLILTGFVVTTGYCPSTLLPSCTMKSDCLGSMSTFRAYPIPLV